MSNQPKWERFWFDGNRYFGRIESPGDWQKLRDAYDDKSDEYLLLANECRDSKKPNFGFRREHVGPKTLRDFFNEHGMTPPPKP
jgi:hypothetical protein